MKTTQWRSIFFPKRDFFTDVQGKNGQESVFFPERGFFTNVQGKNGQRKWFFPAWIGNHLEFCTIEKGADRFFLPGNFFYLEKNNRSAERVTIQPGGKKNRGQILYLER